MGKFHSCQAVIGRKNRRPGHGNPGHDTDPAAFQQLHSVHAVLETDDQSREAFIRSQNVCSCAKNNRFYVQFPGHLQNFGKFLLILGECHNRSRAANAKGRVFAHGFVKTKRNLRQIIRNSLLKLV